jgi:hypothetical protein
MADGIKGTVRWARFEVQGNSQVPPELPNSAAQQPRQTQQKEEYQYL